MESDGKCTLYIPLEVEIIFKDMMGGWSVGWSGKRLTVQPFHGETDFRIRFFEYFLNKLIYLYIRVGVRSNLTP